VLDAILNNRLLLAAVIFLFLVLVPVLVVVCGRKLRDPLRPDRRGHVRIGLDRRV
jgi:hypothetical protein